MKTIITVTDYQGYQPNSINKYTSAEITSAINLSYTLLDAECAGAITNRWDKTETEEGYLTPEQKEHIKNAFFIETQYVLMCGLDFSNGSENLSIGGFSMSSNRPSNRNLISQQALKELQLAGVWYQTNFVKLKNGGGKLNYLDDLAKPLWDDCPLPESISNKRYIWQFTENKEQFGKWIKYDTQGRVEFVEGINPETYATKEWVQDFYYNKGYIDVIEDRLHNVEIAITGITYAYVVSIKDNPDFDTKDRSVKISQFTDIEGKVITSSDLPLGANVYVVETGVYDRWYAGEDTFYILDTEKPDLTNYYTKQEVDDKITAETTARVDADTELGNRITVEAGTRNNADINLGLRIDSEAQIREDNDTNLQKNIDLKQYITDDNLETTSKEVVGAINEVYSKLNSLEATWTGLQYYFGANQERATYTVNCNSPTGTKAIITGANFVSFNDDQIDARAPYLESFIRLSDTSFSVTLQRPKINLERNGYFNVFFAYWTK